MTEETNKIEKNKAHVPGKSAMKRAPTKRPITGRGGRQVKNEFDQKLLSVRRVARVVAGGRRFSLSVALAIGDRGGRVGVGLGKGGDQSIAREKAFNNAKKNLVKIPLTQDGGIAKDVAGKFCASRVVIRPTKSGVISGGPVRTIIDLVGIKKANTKLLSRSKSHLNNAMATIKALEQLN